MVFGYIISASVQFLSILSSPIPAKVGRRNTHPTIPCASVIGKLRRFGHPPHHSLQIRAWPDSYKSWFAISLDSVKTIDSFVYCICIITKPNESEWWLTESHESLNLPNTIPERPSNLMINSDARRMAAAADLLSFVWKPTGGERRKKGAFHRTWDAGPRESPSRNWICGVAAEPTQLLDSMLPQDGITDLKKWHECHILAS